MVERVIFARMNSIEREILALEKEYKELYAILTGEDMTENKEEKEEQKKCVECGKPFPLGEFYSYDDRGVKRYYTRCKNCTRSYRNAVNKYGRPKKQEDAATKRKKKGSNFDEINQAQNEAAANGMSYGQWVARQYLEEEKRRRSK